MFRNKKTIKIIIACFVAALAFAIPALLTTNAVAADSSLVCGNGQAPQSDGTCQDGSTPVGAQPIPQTTDNPQCTDSGCDLVSKYVQPLSDFLAAGVGIIVIINVVIGGIQYSASQDNPQAVSAAKGRIVNSLIALLVFAFMWALLQWLAPGGIF